MEKKKEKNYYLPYIHSAYDYDIVDIMCISNSVLILIPIDSILLFGLNNYYYIT